MQTQTKSNTCACVAGPLLLFFIIISAGPCSKMEWDWMTSPRPRPLPLPLGPRPRSPSFLSDVGPLLTFDLTVTATGQQTRKPPVADIICLSVMNSLLFNFPPYYVGRECFLQNKRGITIGSVLVLADCVCYPACYLLHPPQREVSRSY